MGKSGKLKVALDQNKGVDYSLERQKKFQKAANKKRKEISLQEQALQNELQEKYALEDDDEDEEDGGVALDVDYDDIDEEMIDISKIDETDSSDDSSDNDDNDVIDKVGENADHDSDHNRVSLPPKNSKPKNHKGEEGGTEEDEDEDEEEDIPFSDIASLDSEERGDAIPFQRLTINNHSALATSLSRIAINKTSLPFSVLQTVTSSSPTKIEDSNDDLNRELQFYAQSLDAVKDAYKKLKAEGVSFSRPDDFFAEMVKSEEHMGRVKQRLVDDAAGKKAAADARKQRDLKKYGKAVQIAKQQERDKAKRDTLEQINVLKRKRANALPSNENEQDLFDVALETETKRSRVSNGGKSFDKSGRKSDANFKRQSKNEKYGFGGKKRFSKSGDALSSAGIGLKKKFTPKKRLGKSRRDNGRS